MALEVVEGILQPSQPKSNRRGYGLFPELTIISASGQARVFNKVATGEPVTSAVIAGGQGLKILELNPKFLDPTARGDVYAAADPEDVVVLCE